MGALLVEQDASRAPVLELVADKVNLQGPDRMRGLPEVAVEFVDGDFGNERRGKAAARVQNTPEDTAIAHESTNGFGQGAFGRNKEPRVRVLLVGVLGCSVGEGTMLKQGRNGNPS